MLTRLQNKGLHSRQSKHLTSKAAQEEKNEKLTRAHTVALSSKYRFKDG